MILEDLVRESIRKTDWPEVWSRIGLLGLLVGSVWLSVMIYGRLAWMVWEWVSP